MPALSPAQLGGFRRDGYVLVPGVVPRSLVDRASAAILAFIGADLERAETWYRADPRACNVVPIHHPQAFWDVRQHPAVHEAFAALLGSERLWVSMDRGRFKPPVSAKHPHGDDTRLHWDLDPRRPEARQGVQGLVYLSDAPEGLGPFECVPSLFRELPAWLEVNEVNEALEPEIGGREVVPGRAGDLVVWRAWLPHQGAPNGDAGGADAAGKEGSPFCDPRVRNRLTIPDRRVTDSLVMARHADPHAKDALIAAARAEFARRGLRGARIEDITAACGLSKGSFYLHFESKEGLFGALVHAFVEEMRQAAEARLKESLVFFEENGPLNSADFQKSSGRLRRWDELELAMDLRTLELMWRYRDVLDVLISGCQGTPFEKTVWEMVDAEQARIAENHRQFQCSGCLRTDVAPELFGALVVGTYLLVGKQMANAVEKPDLASMARALQTLIHEGSLPRVRKPQGRKLRTTAAVRSSR